MTVQTMSVSYGAYIRGSEKSVKSGTEQSFEAFLGTDGAKRTVVKSEKSSVRSPERMADGKSLEKKDSKLVSETKDKLSNEQLNESDADSVVTESSVLMDESQTEKTKLSEDILAEILSILNGFVNTFQNGLQIGEQELLDSAEMIHFGVSDFFDADRMKELFLQVQGTEMSELLTDEELYKSLEEMQDMFSEILENSEIYQLLEKEGLTTDGFDMKVFENQIEAFIEGRTEAQTSNAEVMINFDGSSAESELQDSVEVVSQSSDDGAVFEETVQSSENGTEGDEQNQPESGQSKDQAGLFLQKLVSVAKESVTESIQNVQGGFELYDIASQIIEQVKIHIRPENTRMELQLNPEQLGRVELEITSKNGELSARMNVQNDQVKEAVESQMQVLCETLEAQGLKVENIEVTVAEFGFRFQDEQGNAQQFQQGRQRNSFEFDEVTETEEQSFSDVSEVMKELNGNSVDYVA